MTGADPTLDSLREEVLEAVRRYADAAFPEPELGAAADDAPISVAGRVIGAPELSALVDASLDGWLTEGRFAERFRTAFAAVTGRSQAALVGSGSQANLLAVAVACSDLLERPLRPGDEVITPALAFPTTVNPIYQQGLVPVFVDVEPDTLNPTLESVAAAVGPRTRAVFAAHCLGNPFDAAGIAEMCAREGLVLLEDCCDALGSTLDGRSVGTFGAAATYSFYAAHHITTGEGGAITTDDPEWGRAVSSLREWGRDCWCPPGVNDVCGRRFEGRFGDMPEGYDHKYVYSHLGYNFKITDMQAALGLAQLERLEDLHAARRRNFARLNAAFAPLGDQLVLPRALPGADPSWFGYPFALREGGASRRRALQLHMREQRIDSRLALAGNITRQPAYLNREHRIAAALEGADFVTESSLWVGVHPRMTDAMLDRVAESVTDFLRTR
jgi:CDP-4-dehydro-6-deoxyglucose reductase, E1